MKHVLFFTCFLLTNYLVAQPITPPYIRIGGTFDTNTNQVVGGTTYTNGSTVWVDCGTSSITVSVTILPSPYEVAWFTSSNFTKSAVGGVAYIQTVQLDPNKGDGYISVVYALPPYPNTSPVMSINIKQKPSVPGNSGEREPAFRGT